jgi:hypothetical protein
MSSREGIGSIGISFEATIAKVGTRWRATLVQTGGGPVLSEDALTFDGRSLAAATARVDDYISSLEVDDWSVSFDFSPALDPHLERAIDDVDHVREQAERAEYEMVRTTHQTIETLLGAGFSQKDVALVLGRSKSDVQRILREGRVLDEFLGQAGRDS